MSLISEISGEEEGAISKINVTSLVDVMFCLLIMFMVATPLMSKDVLQVDVPKARGKTLTEEQFLYSVLSIDAQGTVFLGTVPLAPDIETMSQEISSNDKLKKEGMALIQADKSIAYKRVMDVLEALKKAGIQEVGFLTDPRVKEILAKAGQGG